MSAANVRIGIVTAESPLVMANKFVTNSPYVRAVQRAGGLPVLIPVHEDAGVAAAYAEMIDGLLLPGGQDISPLLFGEQPHPSVRYSLADHDRLEMALLREAVARGIPVFGICRGMQLINVTFGGTLIQDLPSEMAARAQGAKNSAPEPICHLQEMAIRSELTHSVTLTPGTLAASLLCKDAVESAPPGGHFEAAAHERDPFDSSIAVNSFHHQAVRDVAPGFTVSAVAPDGVVEAMEDRTRNIYAVQWHPEELCERYPVFRNLFSQLTEMAARRRGETEQNFVHD